MTKDIDYNEGLKVSFNEFMDAFNKEAPEAYADQVQMLRRIFTDLLLLGFSSGFNAAVDFVEKENEPKGKILKVSSEESRIISPAEYYEEAN